MASCLLTGIAGVQVARDRHARALDEASRGIARAAALALPPSARDAGGSDRDARVLDSLVEATPGIVRAVAWVADPGDAPRLRFDTAGADVPRHASSAVTELLRDGVPRRSGSGGDAATHVPVLDEAGDVIGALSVWRAAPSLSDWLGDLAAVVAAACACGVGLFWLLGRPMRRIERAAAGDDRSGGLGAVARRIESRLATERIEARVERIAHVRTKDLEVRLRHQEDLLSNTAHELRTPLTVVMASVGLLREGDITDANELRMILAHANSACQHLLFLINDLVDSAAADVGRLRMDVQACSVDELAEEIDDLIEPIASARGIDFGVVRSAAAMSVHADRNRLMQVVFNLVGNALKFSPDGSRVELGISEDDAEVRFEVRDRGIGVPLAQQEGLFQRFSRLHDPASSSASGNGVGLHLCKILLELMGGRIGYRAREDGNGSVFWFQLPKATANHATSVT